MFFIVLGGKAVGRIFEQKCCPSRIPRGGLQILKLTFSIPHEGLRSLDRLREINQTNYNDPFPEAADISTYHGKFCQLKHVLKCVPNILYRKTRSVISQTIKG